MSEFVWDYAIISALIGIIGFYLGLNYILAFAVSNNKQSYIVFALSAVLILSTILMLV